MVWARRRVDHSLYYLEENSALKVRAWVKENVECLVPDCEDPRLTTVHRSRGRDGFSHYSGSGGHEPESEEHHQGKAVVLEWVNATLGADGVVADAEEGSPDGSRRSDVRVLWPDGRQVAVEVQYSALSVGAWRARHDSYLEQGIRDVWLLGHVGDHMKARRGAAGMVALGAVHAAILKAGVPLLWINPVERRIGTVMVDAEPHQGRRGSRYRDGHDGEVFHVPPTAAVVASSGEVTGPDRARFVADALAECTLSPDGLLSPWLVRLRAGAAELARVDAARRREDQRRAQTAAAAARTAGAERARQQQVWDASELRAGLLARHGGVLPGVLTRALGSESAVYAPREQWRAVIYDACVRRRVGDSFTVAEAYAALGRAGIVSDPARLRRAVVAWLEHLQRQRLVRLRRGRDARSIDSVEVLSDLPPATPAVRPAPVATAPTLATATGPSSTASSRAEQPAPPSPSLAQQPPVEVPAPPAGSPQPGTLSPPEGPRRRRPWWSRVLGGIARRRP